MGEPVRGGEARLIEWGVVPLAGGDDGGGGNGVLDLECSSSSPMGNGSSGGREAEVEAIDADLLVFLHIPSNDFFTFTAALESDFALTKLRARSFPFLLPPLASTLCASLVLAEGRSTVEPEGDVADCEEGPAWGAGDDHGDAEEVPPAAPAPFALSCSNMRRT
jgi:hypothetical protein